MKNEHELYLYFGRNSSQQRNQKNMWGKIQCVNKSICWALQQKKWSLHLQMVLKEFIIFNSHLTDKNRLKADNAWSVQFSGDGNKNEDLRKIQLDHFHRQNIAPHLVCFISMFKSMIYEWLQDLKHSEYSKVARILHNMKITCFFLYNKTT